MSVILTSKHYKNLEYNLGERNNITLVKGKEYKIDTTTSIKLEDSETTVNTNWTTSSNVDFKQSGVVNYPFSTVYLRAEQSFTTGSFDFTYSSSILKNSDLKNLTINFTATGKKYKTDTVGFIDSSNRSSSKSVFSGIINETNKIEDFLINNTSDSLQSIPYSNAEAYSWGTLLDLSTPKVNVGLSYVRANFVKKETVGVTITYYFHVDYKILTCTGWNRIDKGLLWENNQNYCNVINSFTISINSVGIKATSFDREYGTGNKILELQTNELMQSQMDDSEPMFDYISRDIIDNFSNNRLIVNFKMLFNEKFEINGENRLLRAGDKIKIKDLHGNFIGEYINDEDEIDGSEFEILKIENCFEGLFFRNIVCRQDDITKSDFYTFGLKFTEITGGYEVTPGIINADNVIIPFHFGGKSVIKISGFGLYPIESISLPNSILEISTNTFSTCEELIKIIIPESVTSIGVWAFNGCNSLIYVKILATTPPTLSNSDNFDNTFEPYATYPIFVPDGTLANYQTAWSAKLRDINRLHEWVASTGLSYTWVSELNGYEVSNGTSTDTVVIIPSEYDDLTNGLHDIVRIAYSGFLNKTTITCVIIPNTVTTIEESAFDSCTGLTYIEIPNSVISIGESAFYNCSSLTSVKLPSTLTTIKDSAFINCSGLTSITIPNSVTSIKTAAFANCSSLGFITTLAITPPTLGNYAFDNTDNCTIYVPKGTLSDYQTVWSAYSARLEETT